VPSDVTKTKSLSRFPVFLPDGNHFLYTEIGAPEKNGVYLNSLDGNENRRVLADLSNVVFGAGPLLFVRENMLMAQPFDARSSQVSGDALLVAEAVSFTAGINFALVTVSENGMLLYANADTGQIVWFDRAGKFLSPLDAPGVVSEPSIS